MFALPNAGSRVLYHIGKRPAKPEPYRLDLAQGWSHRKSGYVPAPHEKVVFLTPSPATVAANHGIPKGHVYAYEVPHSVVKALGGINVLDQAPEIAIPERLWGQVRFLGRSETDTVQFHRESASQRLPRPRWRLDIRFPREVREARHQFWQQAMRGLGLRHAPSEAWLNHPESDNTPFLWPRLLAKHLREAYPEACRRLLEQAGKGGTVRPHFDLPQEVNKKPLLPRAVPDMNDRLARLLFPSKFTSLILRRLDLLLLAGSRHPERKPPTRAHFNPKQAYAGRGTLGVSEQYARTVTAALLNKGAFSGAVTRPDGNVVEFKATVEFRPGSVSGHIFDLAYSREGRAPYKLVLFTVPWRKKATSQQAEDLQRVVVHEFTHLLDPTPTQKELRAADLAEDRMRFYYNRPTEVTAYRHEVVYELDQSGAERRPDESLLSFTRTHSAVWRMIEPFLDETSRRRILTAVARRA